MKEKIDRNLIGLWHIYEMEHYDNDDHLHMEGQAFIEIREDNTGNFQFEITYGYLKGKMVRGKKFEFNWEGSERGQDISGSGWVKLKNKNTIKGEFRSFLTDDYEFLARRAE